MESELAGEPAFDVLARLAANVTPVQVRERAQAAGVPVERVEAILKALRSVPQVQIGKAVTRARADSAKALYEPCGLVIDLTPVLAIQAKRVDEEVACPSCRQRVMLTDKRQCPSCGVFVDKFTQEYEDKRRQAELERAKLRREMEGEFQKKLDEELVKKLKEQGVFKGRAGAGRAVALVVLLGVAFVGGRATLAGWKLDTLLKPRGSPANEMLATAFPAGASAAPAEGASAPVSDVLAAEMDDPLIQAAGGKRMGAKGLSLEQAVAASRVLARAAGNTTADRAIDGAPGGAGAADAPAGEPGAPAAGAAAVPAEVRTALALDFARQLAEMGQVGRANEVLKALKPRAQGPQLSAQAQAAALEIRAWALQGMAPGQQAGAAQALLAEGDGIADPVARVRALTDAGLALSQQPRVPREAARALVARAGEHIGAIQSAEVRELTLATWSVALGRVLLNESTAAAKAGRWKQAKAAAEQLQALAQKAPGTTSRARLLAMTYQLQAVNGDSGAAKNLDAALSLANSAPTLPERAALLRSITNDAAMAGSEPIGKAIDALQAQAQSRPGLERAQALTELSLLQVESGFRHRGAELAQAARETPGLSPNDAVRVNTELVVRSDLTAARMLQGAGMYAEAESLLQRLGGYLL